MATLTPDGLQVVLEGVGIISPIPSFPLADTKNSPVDIYISYLADTLAQLTGCEPSIAYESIQWANDVGDLVVMLPRLRLPDVDPKVLSDTLQHNFPETPLYAAPFSDGYQLRFYFDSCTLAGVVLPYILDRGYSYGKDECAGSRDHETPDGRRKKVVVEFSSPNLGQEFDGNHLRSTILGAYIASLYESMGWDVYRMNFLGDWGKNIGLLAAGWFRFGSEELFDADPLKHLLNIYTRIGALLKAEQDAAKSESAESRDTPIADERDAFFKRMEDGDADALTLWQRFREVCVAKYAELYARLHIDFDEYSGESRVQHETTVEVEKALKEQGVEEEGEEAWIINFKGQGHKGLGAPVARHRNGTTSYLLRDIAAVLERNRKHSFDKMIYVVSAKQDSHFQQVFKALELMGQTELAGRLQHVSFGKSQGLSPKSGASGLLLGDILDQCRDAILEFLQAHSDDFPALQNEDESKVADTLGLMTLMTEALSIKRANNFLFDLAKIANYDGYTGLALQYWLERVRLRLKASPVDRDRLVGADYSMFEEEAYAPFVDVLRLLVQFPGIVKSSFRTLEPSTILIYLFRLVDLLPAVWDAKDAQQDENENKFGEGQVGEGDDMVKAEEGNHGSSKGELLPRDGSSEDGVPVRAKDLLVPEEITQDRNPGYGFPSLTDEERSHIEPQRNEVQQDGHSENAANGERGVEEAKENQPTQQAEEHNHPEEETRGQPSQGPATSHLGEVAHKSEPPQLDTPGQAESTQLPDDTEHQDLVVNGIDHIDKGGEAHSTEVPDKGKQRAAAEEETESEFSQQDLLKLAFYECVRHVLENGIQMVGLAPMPV